MAFCFAACAAFSCSTCQEGRIGITYERHAPVLFYTVEQCQRICKEIGHIKAIRRARCHHRRVATERLVTLDNTLLKTMGLYAKECVERYASHRGVTNPIYFYLLSHIAFFMFRVSFIAFYFSWFIVFGFPCLSLCQHHTVTALRPLQLFVSETLASQHTLDN